MSEIKVSNRYALALIEMSVEKKIFERVQKDVLLFSDTLNKNRNLLVAMVNPVIKPVIKKNILKEIFSKRVHPDTLSFLNFIIDKGRENLMQSVSERFLELADDYQGIAKVKVRVAFEFADDQKKLLKEKLDKILNKHSELKFSLDPALIGGFIAQVGDTLFDASIRHQLDLLRKEFKKGSKALN